MSTPYDDALITQHFWKIQVLAMRALEGENVKVDAKSIVMNALEQFDTSSVGEPAVNRAAFKRKLKFMASITHPNQPAQKEAFEYAASLIPGESRIKQ